MKILNISDTHSKHNQIPKEWLTPADCIIHAGDISTRGYEHEIKNFLDWYSKLDQYKYKIFIAGNHDWYFQDYSSKVQEILKEYPNIIYLQDSGIELDGIKFWGSPVQPTFFNWAFNKDRGEAIDKHWQLIPNGIDVLITHGPARGHGDLVINKWSPNSGESVGCEDLLRAVERVKPKFSICGHIHGARSASYNKDTCFINASLLNEDYMVVNRPITFELTDGVVSNVKV